MSATHVELKWNSSLDIGVEAMNREHQDLIAQMSRVERINLRGTKTEISEAFDDLITATELHFRDEEELMEKYKYPGIGFHVKLHESMLQTLQRHQEEYDRGTWAHLPSAVFDFFRLWIATHIMIADRKYGEWITAQEGKRSGAG